MATHETASRAVFATAMLFPQALFEFAALVLDQFSAPAATAALADPTTQGGDENIDPAGDEQPIDDNATGEPPVDTAPEPVVLVGEPTVDTDFILAIDNGGRVWPPPYTDLRGRVAYWRQVLGGEAYTGHQLRSTFQGRMRARQRLRRLLVRNGVVRPVVSPPRFETSSPRITPVVDPPVHVDEETEVELPAQALPSPVISPVAALAPVAEPQPVTTSSGAGRVPRRRRQLRVGYRRKVIAWKRQPAGCVPAARRPEKEAEQPKAVEVVAATAPLPSELAATASSSPKPVPVAPVTAETVETVATPVALSSELVVATADSPKPVPAPPVAVERSVFDDFVAMGAAIVSAANSPPSSFVEEEEDMEDTESVASSVDSDVDREGELAVSRFHLPDCAQGLFGLVKPDPVKVFLDSIMDEAPGDPFEDEDTLIFDVPPDVTDDCSSGCDSDWSIPDAAESPVAAEELELEDVAWEDAMPSAADIFYGSFGSAEGQVGGTEEEEEAIGGTWDFTTNPEIAAVNRLADDLGVGLLGDSSPQDMTTHGLPAIGQYAYGASVPGLLEQPSAYLHPYHDVFMGAEDLKWEDFNGDADADAFQQTASQQEDPLGASTVPDPGTDALLNQIGTSEAGLNQYVVEETGLTMEQLDEFIVDLEQPIPEAATTGESRLAPTDDSGLAAGQGTKRTLEDEGASTREGKRRALDLPGTEAVSAEADVSSTVPLSDPTGQADQGRKRKRSEEEPDQSLFEGEDPILDATGGEPAAET